jgi:hypothetical protein
MVIVNEVKNRLHRRNQNYLAIITGPTGSGKSYSALTFALAIDPNFNIDRIAFTDEEFFSLLNSGKLKKGMVVVFDEAGVAVNARDWYSFSNKAINYVMQTFRRDNLAVIFTAPTFDLDAQIKKLFHAYIETQTINRKEKKCICKYLNMQYNPRGDKGRGKVYYKFTRVKDGYKPKVMTKLSFRLPPEKLIKEYEAKKKDFTGELNVGLQEELAKRKEKAAQTGQRIPVEDHIESVLANPQDYIKEWSGRSFIDLNGIMLKLKVGEPTAKKIRAGVENIFKKKGLIGSAKQTKLEKDVRIKASPHSQADKKRNSASQV